jgi:hypothetical protein
MSAEAGIWWYWMPIEMGGDLSQQGGGELSSTDVLLLVLLNLREQLFDLRLGRVSFFLCRL